MTTVGEYILMTGGLYLGLVATYYLNNPFPIKRLHCLVLLILLSVLMAHPGQLLEQN